MTRETPHSDSSISSQHRSHRQTDVTSPRAGEPSPSPSLPSQRGARCQSDDGACGILNKPHFRTCVQEIPSPYFGQRQEWDEAAAPTPSAIPLAVGHGRSHEATLVSQWGRESNRKAPIRLFVHLILLIKSESGRDIATPMTSLSLENAKIYFMAFMGDDPPSGRTPNFCMDRCEQLDSEGTVCGTYHALCKQTPPSRLGL